MAAAEVIGLTPETLRKRLQRARERMVKEMHAETVPLQNKVQAVSRLK
jgi:DNA-directed RNA polymerase specialized sigma24 family protein